MFVRHEMHYKGSRSRQGFWRPFTGFLDPPKFVSLPFTMGSPHYNPFDLGRTNALQMLVKLFR